MRLPTRLLKRLSIARLQKIIQQKRREARVAPLERERARLLRRIKKIDNRIARLRGDAVAAKPPRRKRRVSAATRRKMAAAQRARWTKKRIAVEKKAAAAGA